MTMHGPQVVTYELSSTYLLYHNNNISRCSEQVETDFSYGKRKTTSQC